MPLNLNWAMIQTGATFQSLVNTLLLFEHAGTRVFGRAGKDAGLDALSENKKVAYQYKYHSGASFAKTISDAKGELAKITIYRQPTDSRYSHWEQVTDWIFVTNVTTNPNDQKRWDDEIIPNFARLNLTATLWGLERMTALLTKHSHVANAYFEGQNRCFLSLGEAYEFTSEEEIGAIGLEVPFVGREADVAKIDAFLAEDKKKLLCVQGPGGIGKSRLLLELGNKAETKGYQILWGMEASLSNNQQWYSAIPYTLQTLLFLDEPQDPNLVNVLIEQLRIPNGQARTWKVIFAVRSPNDPVLKAVSNMPAAMRDDTLVMSPLSQEQSKYLALSLINKSQLSSCPAAEKDNLADHLSRLGDKYPIWIAMAVNTLAKHGNLSSLPQNAEEIARKYLSEVIELGSSHICSHRQLEEALRWLAIYEEINIEDYPLLQFLSQQSEFANTDQFVECLNSVSRRKFIVRRGANQRLYSIKPDVMRDYIVRDWLIQGSDNAYEPTPSARKVVRLIVDGYDEKPVPRVHSLMRGLAKAELLIRFQGKQLDFLSPLVAEIKRITHEGTTLDQKAIIGYFSSFDFARLTDIVDIIRTLRLTEKPPSEIKDLFGNRHVVTHHEIVSELAWPLFNAAKYARTSDERRAVLNELVAISLAEFEISDTPRNDGKRADALIPRAISGENNWYTGFAEEVFKMAIAYASRLLEKNGLNRAQLNLTRVLCTPFLSIEREYTTYRANSFTVHQSLISLTSPEWDKRNILRSKIKECASSDDSSECCRLLSWSLMSEAHSSANRARIGAGKNLPPNFLTEIDKDIKEDLNWVLATLPRRQIISTSELKAARHLWEWHVNFEKDDNIKNIALECEQLYQKDPRVATFHVFFSFELYEQALIKAGEVGETFGRQGTSHQIKDFLRQAHEFAPETTQWGGILEIARHISAHWDSNKEVPIFVLDSLGGLPNGIEFRFATAVLNHRLRVLRNSSQLEVLRIQLQSAEKAVVTRASKAKLISNLYRQPHPGLVGVLTSIDFEFLSSQLVELSEEFLPELKCQLLVGMFHVNWEKIEQLCTSIFLASDGHGRLRCFLATLDTLHLSDLFAKQFPNLAINESQYEWLLELMVKVPDLDAINDSAQWHLDQFTQRFGRRGLSWLLSVIESRVVEAAALNADENNVYKIIPTRHRLTKYVTPLAIDTQVSPFTKKSLIGLLDYANRKDILGYFIAEYVTDIDPSGVVIPELIEERIRSVSADKQEIWKWARFAGHYAFNSQPWHRIAKAAVQAAEALPSGERGSIFASILSQEIKSSSYPAGEMDPRPARELAARQKELQDETDPTLLPFREWHLKVAQAEYDQEVARYKEEIET